MERLHRQAAAFRDLLGFQDLPQNGREAKAAAHQLGAVVMAGAAAPPLLSDLVREEVEAAPLPRPRFVDVSTGLRLRYLEWGPSGGGEVVLLLHDLGEAADIWRRVGPRLGERGYRTIALDLRGHGESGRSLDGRYSAEALAEDVKAFIVARDLYVTPLAVVGCGMGAAAGLALAQGAPFLVGALLAAEFALPAGAADGSGAGGGAGGAAISEAPDGPAAAPGGATRAGGGSSKQLLPWWGFRVGQASAFSSVEQCAAFLAHPLANLAPSLLVPLQAAAARQAAADAVAAAGSDSGSSSDSASDCDSPGSPDSCVRGGGAAGGQPGKGGEAGQAVAPAAPSVRELFAQLQRPLRGAVASACSLLRLPAWLAEGRSADYWDDEGDFGAGGVQLQPRMDSSFLFTFDPSALLSGLPDLRCHLLLLRGGRASWAHADDTAAMAAAAAAGGAASAAAAELPGAGHWLAADHPELLLQRIVAFLEGPALRCFDRCPLPGGGASSAGGRRPELLGLRPLPEYSTLEEAQKALGPRRIPTAAAVEEELRKLRLLEGRPPSAPSSDDEDEGGGGGRRTALARDPPNYFGFVG